MNILRHSETGFREKLERIANASSLFDPEIEQRTRQILDAVRERGDAALIELTARFDKAILTPEGLAVTTTERFNASLAASLELREAVALAHRNIEVFSRRSLRRNWSGSNAQGARVGEKFTPFRRVGVYIPGGSAPLV